MTTVIDYVNDQLQPVSDSVLQSMTNEYLNFLEQDFAMPAEFGTAIESLGFPSAAELLAGFNDNITPATIDKGNYKLVRSLSNNKIQGINYANGDKVEYVYDNNGNLMQISDSRSGTKITRVGEAEWQIESSNGFGRPVTFKGDIEINQRTGAITTTLHDGRQITVNPDGQWYQTVTIGGVSTQQRGNGKVTLGEYSFRLVNPRKSVGGSNRLQ